jgi:hypothetical protein
MLPLCVRVCMPLMDPPEAITQAWCDVGSMHATQFPPRLRRMTIVHDRDVKTPAQLSVQALCIYRLCDGPVWQCWADVQVHAVDENMCPSSTCKSHTAPARRFTGTAGTVVVTTDQALLWTDGRYFLQVGCWPYGG